MRPFAAMVVLMSTWIALGSIASASRVGVAPLRGPQAGAVREGLEEAFREAGHDVVPRSELGSAPPGGRIRPQAAGADFVLGGRLRRSGRTWISDFTLERDGVARVRRIRMRASSREQLVERVVAFLEEKVQGFAADPEPEEEPPSEPEPLAEDPAEVEGASTPRAPPRSARRAAEEERLDPLGFRSRSFVELDMGFGFLSRSLTYRDDLFDRIRAYELGSAPTLHFRARVHPFSGSSIPGLRDIGIESESEYVLVADSRREDGQVFPTRASAWSFGLSYRLLFGPHRLRASLAYGMHGFLVDPAGAATPTNDPRPGLPSTRYETIRMGLGFRLVPIGGFSFFGRASYLAVLDAGGVTSDVWFPNARVSALEFTAGLGYRVHRVLEIRGAAQYRRYGFDLRPELGSFYIVGGALDQYWVYSLSVAVIR